MGNNHILPQLGNIKITIKIQSPLIFGSILGANNQWILLMFKWKKNGGLFRDITFPWSGKWLNFAEFGGRNLNSICSENCIKSVVFKNYSKKIDKICVPEFDKSLLSLPVSDFWVFVELPECFSDLKSVLEVAELSVDLDSEVSWFEFGILMDPNFDRMYCTQPTQWKKGQLQRVFQLGILFLKR